MELSQKIASLTNPNAAQCYMNAVYYALKGLLLHRPSLNADWDHRLVNAIDALPGRPREVDLAKVPEWHHLLQNWPIGEQEDAGEFLLHILSLGNRAAFQGMMVIKRPGYDDELQDFVLLSVPVPSSVERGDLVSLLQQWAAPRDDPGYRQWLLAAPKVLFLQLQRFSMSAGVVKKICTPIALNSHIELPIDDPQLETGRTCTYRVCSIILHSGSTPVRGHYTNLLLLDAGKGLYLNDNAVPREVTASDALRLCSVDMYVLCLVRHE